MPSAASKLEKQASSQPQQQAEQATTDNNNANAPIKQAITIIDHKIRNLEKRKTKLESYRAIKSSGKELSADQQAAVDKFDEVAQSLELARDLSKQMQQLAVASEKELKKQARKDAIVRAQQETLKIREVLVIQNIISHFEDERVREDFLSGSNGAIKLSEDDLSGLEQFYLDITVRRSDLADGCDFLTSVQKAAECLSLTIDGRPKQYGKTTFEAIRGVFQQIQDSGYFDQPPAPAVDVENAEPAEVVGEENDAEADVVVEEVVEEEQQQPLVDEEALQQEDAPEEIAEVVAAPLQPQSQQQPPPQVVFASDAPNAAAVPAPVFRQQAPMPILTAQGMPMIPAQAQPMQQRPIVVSPITAQGQPKPQQLHSAPHFPPQPPQTVRAVEQRYFHQQFMNMMPLAEVIGQGANFFFLQDSELDSPEMDEPQVQQQVNNQMPIQQQQPPQQPQQAPLQQPPPPNVVGIVPPSAIPTQTFTNPAFPPIVPPNSMYGRPDPQQQPPQPNLSVFQQPPAMIPMPLLQQQQLDVQQQQMVQVMAQQQQQQQHQMSGPNASSVPLPGFPPAVVAPPQSATDVNQFQNVQNTSPLGGVDHSVVVKSNDDHAESRKESSSNEWDHHRAVREREAATSNESNQWSNEMNNVAAQNAKNVNAAGNSNEWNNSFEANQPHESNHWNSNSHQSSGDGYGRPARNSFGRNDRGNRDGGGRSSGGGDRDQRDQRGGMRPQQSVGGGNSGGGYRGRSNNYPASQTQQNGRSSVYFRNNDNSYYQNGNGGGAGGGGGGGGYNKDSNNRYESNGNGNYRSRGGVGGSNRPGAPGGGNGNGNAGGPQPPRNNPNSANRTGGMGMGPRSGGGGGGTGRGSSYTRPPRQQEIA